MITHPLDLASKLRPAPRSFDWAFYVNFGLIALFFVLFGSRSVLSPALAVNGENLQVASVPARSVNHLPSGLVVSVKANGQKIVDPNGMVNYDQLKDWMADRAKKMPGAIVLVVADKGVTFDEVAKISALAEESGLGCILAAEPAKSGAGE